MHTENFLEEKCYFCDVGVGGWRIMLLYHHQHLHTCCRSKQSFLLANSNGSVADLVPDGMAWVTTTFYMFFHTQILILSHVILLFKHFIINKWAERSAWKEAWNRLQCLFNAKNTTLNAAVALLMMMTTTIPIYWWICVWTPKLERKKYMK